MISRLNGNRAKVSKISTRSEINFNYTDVEREKEGARANVNKDIISISVMNICTSDCDSVIKKF